MYTVCLDGNEIPWTPTDFPGVTRKIIHRDAKTGGMTLLRKLEPGAVIPAHTHTKADETVYVLEGDFLEDGLSHLPGSYFVAPAQIVHGPHSSRTGCVILTTFSDDLDFVPA